MSIVIKVAHRRVRLILSVRDSGVRKGFTELVVRELDSTGRAVVYQMTNVRKGHSRQQEQHMWGHEIAHLSGPTPSSCRILDTPRATQTFFPLWGSSELLVDSLVLTWCLWADWFSELHPFSMPTFPPWVCGCIVADAANRMLNMGPDEALILNTVVS